jgi:hypothetical protein
LTISTAASAACAPPPKDLSGGSVTVVVSELPVSVLASTQLEVIAGSQRVQVGSDAFGGSYQIRSSSPLGSVPLMRAVRVSVVAHTYRIWIRRARSRPTPLHGIWTAGIWGGR